MALSIDVLITYYPQRYSRPIYFD